MQKLPRVTFRDDHLDTYIAGLNDKNVKKVLFTKLLDNLKISINKKKKSCNICYVKDFVIYIQHEDFKNVLGVLEKYFLAKEDFEKCAEIRDLKELV